MGIFSFLIAFLGGERALGDERRTETEREIAKQRYSLLSPTPDEQLRDLATDRPDKTESAYTLDAGHFMHETDIVNYTINQDGGIREESLFFLAPNLKVGLTNDTDLQVIYQPYRYKRDRVVATRETHREVGGGDLVVRLKTNVWGNDGGDTAGAVMPYVVLPVGDRAPGGNEGVEGGLILPFAASITEDWGLGLMTQLDILRGAEHGVYYAQWVNSASVSRSLFGPVSGYAEIFIATSHQQDPVITADSGLTWMVGANTQLDAGINIGVTEEADDLNPFVGVSQRF